MQTCLNMSVLRSEAQSAQGLPRASSRRRPLGTCPCHSMSMSIDFQWDFHLSLCPQKLPASASRWSQDLTRKAFIAAQGRWCGDSRRRSLESFTGAMLKGWSRFQCSNDSRCIGKVLRMYWQWWCFTSHFQTCFRCVGTTLDNRIFTIWNHTIIYRLRTRQSCPGPPHMNLMPRSRA